MVRATPIQGYRVENHVSSSSGKKTPKEAKRLGKIAQAEGGALNVQTLLEQSIW